MQTGKNVQADELMTGSDDDVADDCCGVQLVFVCVYGSGGLVDCVAPAQSGQDRDYSGR